MMRESIESTINSIHNKFSQSVTKLFDIPANEVYPGLEQHATFRILKGDLSFNAYVEISDDGTPEYQFTTGMALSLNDTIMSLCANQIFLEDIPLEKRSIYRRNICTEHNYVDYSYINKINIFNNSNQAFLPVFTDDKRRNTLGNTLFTLCGQILLLRQTSHFLNGHYYFEKKHYQYKRFSEFNHTATRSLDELADRRAMALDSDSYSTVILLDRLFSDEAHALYGIKNSDFGSVLEERLRIAAAAFMLIFSLSAKASNTGDVAKDGREHPNPFSRFMFFLSTLEMAYQQKTNNSFAEESDLLQILISDANTIAKTVNLAPHLIHEKDDISKESFSKSLEEIVERRNKLTKRLAHHSRRACSLMGTESILNGFG